MKRPLTGKEIAKSPFQYSLGRQTVIIVSVPSYKLV